MWTIELKVNIVPKQRVRGRGNIFYTPKETRDCMELLRYKFKEFMQDKMMIPKGINILISEFIIDVITNRGDVDNYIKIILDSGNKILWYDDKQITRIKNIELNRKQKEPYLKMIVNPLENYLGQCIK